MVDRSSIHRRLREVGVDLPPVPAPVAVYVPAVRVWDWIYTSGQLPSVAGQLLAIGKVGAEVDLSTAVDCARSAALNAIAAVLELIDEGESIRVARVGVFVATEGSFLQQAKVADGASTLLGAVFGDAGVHARSAVGVAVLPLDAPVEVELAVVLEGGATQ